MKVTLDYYTDPMQLGKYSGICYDREGNDEKRLQHIITVGHLSVLRFGHATFKIEGISRVCLAQLTRSKHCDYLVRSSRYCSESDTEIMIPNKVPEHLKHRWEEIVKASKELYDEALNIGVKKEDARYILPQGQETELWMTGNYQAWVDFIKLRTSKSAQKEIREVALEVQRQLQEVAPIIFGVANAEG